MIQIPSTGRAVVVPFTDKTKKDIASTLFSLLYCRGGWWDNTSTNTAEIGDQFYIVDNVTGRVLYKAVVGTIFKPEQGISGVIRNKWENPDKERGVLLLIDAVCCNEPLSNLVTNTGRVQSTQRRYCK